MSETTGRDFQLQRRDAPPLAPHGEAEQSWHQCYESGKTFASCALVWNEVIKQRVEKVLKDLRACHKWDPRIYVIESWLSNMVEFFHAGDRLYLDLLRQPTSEAGESPKGGPGPEVDGLLEGLERHEVREPEPLEPGPGGLGYDGTGRSDALPSR